MKNKGNILEVTISLFLFFSIILNFIVLFDFNFNIIRKIKIKYEEKIIENNLVNILERDIYFNGKIDKYILKKKETKCFIETSKNTYYLGIFKYFKLENLEVKEKNIMLDNIEIGRFKYLNCILNHREKKIILENKE